MPLGSDGRPLGASKYVCAPYYNPNPQSGWKEMIRFNIPLKVYTNTYDTDPTNPDPYEPYYYHLGKEIGLTPQEAYDAILNVTTHGNGGFGAWFL